MRKSRFTEEQIAQILTEHRSGVTQTELARKYNVSHKTICNWNKKYGGMEGSDVKKLKQLEQENARLKRIVADQALDLVIAKDVINRFS